MRGCHRHGLMQCLVIVALMLSGCAASGSADRAANTSGSTDISDSGRTFVTTERAGAMEPTVSIGARVIARPTAPKVGEIVVAHLSYDAVLEECGPKPHVIRPGGEACDAPVPRESAAVTIERVVAGPGDEIYVRSGEVYMRAKKADEFVREMTRYVRPCRGLVCEYPGAIVIPPNHWFLMGDNRGASVDSRTWGPVPTSWIIGVATALECTEFSRGRIKWVRRTVQQGCLGVAGLRQ